MVRVAEYCEGNQYHSSTNHCPRTQLSLLSPTRSFSRPSFTLPGFVLPIEASRVQENTIIAIKNLLNACVNHYQPPTKSVESKMRPNCAVFIVGGLVSLLLVIQPAKAIVGIPICAPGTQTCGLAGCFTSAFAVCRSGASAAEAQCFPKLLGAVCWSDETCMELRYTI